MNFKDTYNKGKEKAKKFYENHKTGVKLGLAALGLVAIGGTIYAVETHSEQKALENFTKSLPDKVDYPELGVTFEKVQPEPEPEYDDSIPWECRKWKEEYRETYDKVKEFATTIDLEDGETYIIERNSKYDEYRKAHNLPTNIVSHMIDWDGCYPPDEHEEREE